MFTGNFIAHTRDNGDDKETQSVLDHLKGAAELAGKHASGWGSEFAYSCGMVHDVGKYSDAFQKRIRGANIRVDHATAGGQAFCPTGSKLGMMAAYAVMGHHGGLPNGGLQIQSVGDKSDYTLHGRLKRKVEDYQSYKDELSLPALTPPALSKKWRDGFDAAFFIRMIFSALVDADRLDTESFCNYGKNERGQFSPLKDLQKKLAAHVEKFLNVSGEISALNLKRNELLRDCLKAADSSPGLFKLTAPTGSGKTVASFSFALKHAVKNKMKRIIYIIPYNSIIDQNAAVFENIVGEENVLRHNSTFQYDDSDDEQQKRKLFAVENWDFPIIITSSVQFFESLFSDKPSKCRKLHNIADSVLIFDEAQMIPVPFLLPCVHAIETLVTQYGCTAVLATATQSAIDGKFKGVKPVEISGNPGEIYEALRRVVIKREETELTDEELSDRLLENENALCIVNTRLHAQSLFKKIKAINREGLFHLSTTMHPEHRKRVLEEIRERLKKNLLCRVISTSLVEAGVDLDFSAVYREEAGLDSIVQAAGRCNREGKRSVTDSVVHVFSFAEQKPPRMILSNIGAYRQVSREYSDLACLEAIEAYFNQLFYNLGDENLDLKKVVGMFNDGVKTMSFPFKDAADAFKLIDDSFQETVYFLHGHPEFADRLRSGERSRALFRAIGTYGINLYDGDIKKLREIGGVEFLDDSVMLLMPEYYEDEIGVTLTPEGGKGIFS